MPDFSWLPPPLPDLLPRILSAIKARLKLDVLTVGLPALTLVIGFIGYMMLDFDGTFHSFTSVVFGTLGSFKVTFKPETPHNKLTDLAAIFGVLFVYTWFFALAYTMLRESFEKALARLFERNHIVIIGDSDFATRADKLWRAVGRHPLRVISCDKAAPPDWRSRRVRAPFDQTLVRAFAVHRAKHVLIDLGEDMQTLTLAFQLLAGVVERHKGRNPDSEWIIVVRNAALADHFAIKIRELRSDDGMQTSLPNLHYLDPERLAARHFLSGHPLFLLAESRGQRRVHALVVGNAPIASHLIEMTFLTSLTEGQEKPAVTVLTAKPEADRHAFFSGRSALADAVDIVFIDAEALDAFERHDGSAAELLDKREAQMPFTVAFLASANAPDNIRSALLLSRIQRKLSRLRCPIFSYEANAAEAEFLAASEAFSKAIGGFEVFGLPDDYLTQQICDAEKRDQLARALHERYRKQATVPTQTWNELTESLRRANRNAADHWRAKMYMLGFDIGDVAAGALASLREADADALYRLPIDAGTDGEASAMAAAVRCEHERWTMERLLDGWSPGPKRDNDRQIHNLLVPWDVLKRDFPAEVPKDADQIYAIIENLVAHGDPQFVLKRRISEDAAPDVAA